MSTVSAATAAIAKASNDELDLIIDAIKRRRKALEATRAAAVHEGMHAVIEGISPQYLNGLTGVVDSIRGARAAFRLDETSTKRLARSAGGRYSFLAGATEHVFGGIPLACLAPR